MRDPAVQYLHCHCEVRLQSPTESGSKNLFPPSEHQIPLSEFEFEAGTETLSGFDRLF